MSSGGSICFISGADPPSPLFGSKTARMPRHPSQEIKPGTLNAILKDLGIKG